MSDPWPDAATDHQQPFFDPASNDDPSSSTRWMRPSRRKRVSAISVILILTLPFVFLLWMTSWVADHPQPEAHSASESQDAFVLNPQFDLTSGPQTRVYHWTVSTIPFLSGNHNAKNRTVVNGCSPGPLIEANAHDRILVYVTNGLAEEGTSIHWHGLPQPDTPFYDGAPGISQCPIPPGETLLYNFTFGGWTGTTWWHGHDSMQHTDGLYGPLIVHASPSAETLGQTYSGEHVLTFADILETPGTELLKTYRASQSIETTPEPVPDSLAINGKGGGSHPAEAADRRGNNIQAGTPGSPVVAARAPQETHGEEDNPGYPTPTNGGEEGYFEVEVEEGTTTRLRLIHAGTFAPMRISVDAHVLTIIAADGTPVTPIGVQDLVLQPAQRYDVLVTREQGDERQEFWIRAKMIDDKFAYVNHHMQPEARAILRYTSVPTSTSALAPLPTTPPGPWRTLEGEVEWYALPEFNEWALRPAGDSRSSSRATTADSFPNTNIYTIPFIFSIQRTHDRDWRSFINGTSWEIPPPGEAALVADTAGIYTDAGPSGVTAWPIVYPGNQLIAPLKFNQTVDFVITNLDDGDHPFNLHGYAPWLLGVGTGRYKVAKDYVNLDTTNPLRRDTFTVPSRGWAVVRILANNPGYWAFHCHIVWHMMGGGIFQLAVSPGPGANKLTFPNDIMEQCRMWSV
ncbi:Multicopper oxidase [Mycena venus]|uniref:Multicopper oxidase n=1 Tax=Mycena venus TaxID=2733690 RepID=A0A8H6YQ82_9AGAR|nr:Multicopper oxidase [Mycena venus]